MKKIIITGANGFLGNHLEQEILFQYPECEIIKITSDICNLANPNDTSKWEFDNHDKISDVDYIFHLAVYTSSVDFDDVYFLNQYINTNILKLWSRSCPNAKMVAFGTRASYPYRKYDNYNQDEELINTWETTEGYYMNEYISGNYLAYVMTKRMLLTGLQVLNQSHNLKWLYFIPSTLYGPNFRENDSHIIPSLLRDLFLDKKTDFIEFGYSKNLLYVKDACKMIVESIHKENELINLFSNDNLLSSEIIERIKKIENLEIENQLSYNIGKQILVPNKFKDFEFTKLEDGLSETVKFFKEKNFNN